MGEDRHEDIRERAYQIWEREGRLDGDHERHWHTAQDELNREAVLPLTADDTLPQSRQIAGSDVLTVEALAMRKDISGDQAQELLDRFGNDRAALEEAERNLKSQKR